MPVVDEFIEIYQGLTKAYGHTTVVGVREDGKQKVESRIIHKEPDVSLWQKHLEGKEPSLGIIPIRENNSCIWGCIDVDDYSADLKTVNRKVREAELPLIVCRSKSGGAHIFIFLKEPTPAATVRAKLKEVAAGLGFSKSEIFPKQSNILIERGDTGSFLNLPYFGGDNTTRYALKKDGTPATLKQFILAAKKAALSTRELSKIKLVIKKDEIRDGPPCLQYLVTKGFPQGTRNNGLFNLGVYLRKALPDTWQSEIEIYNRKHMDPPLTAAEVLRVAKQVDRKDYNYKCNDQPICDHCNSAICKTRKFGISPSSAIPSFGSLTKQDSNPPVWFLDVEEKRIELDTESLQNQQKFQRACMNSLNKMPPKMNDRAWQSIVQNLLDTCSIVEVPEEVSTSGQFKDLLEAFCTDRAQAQVRDEMILGMPWTSEGKTYFRLRDLNDYLYRHNFRHYTQAQITARLREMEAESGFFNIKGRGCNWWRIPEYKQQTEGFAVPNMKDNTI